jgi:hypothetical protein
VIGLMQEIPALGQGRLSTGRLGKEAAQRRKRFSPNRLLCPIHLVRSRRVA